MGYKMAFSTMAPTQKMEYGDPIWAEFNRSFVNRDLELTDIANAIYLGHPFTTWHRNNWRHGKNYLLGQHIGIDFDTEDQRSTLAYLAKDKFVQKYASLIYTTPSHTPEAPRARVLFLLDTPIHQANNYTAAASALLWLFGCTADRKCKDACRFFYGSYSCEVEWLDQVLPLDRVRQIIDQFKKSGELAKRTHERNYAPTADQAEVAAALKKIPAWGIDYDEWLRVLMGIHNAFGDAGLGLAESWAQGADGEVRSKWRSFHHNGNGAGQVTINSVFKMAREHGWDGEL